MGDQGGSVEAGGVPGWDVRRVRALAPDARSFADARRLAASAVWSGELVVDHIVRGRCQGSAARPYEVTVDLAGPTAGCTCPSHKQPCKHALALLLRRVGGGAVAGRGGGSGDDVPHPADRVDGDGRDGAGARAAAPAGRGAEADPRAQARRLERRLALMDGGVAELRRWLDDVVLDGLAATRGRPHAWWDRLGGRLVDAQLPGLADRVRTLPGRVAGREDWAEVLLAELARLHLAVVAWSRRDDLDPADAADLRTFLGWARTAEEVLAGERVAGEWAVLGVGTSRTGRLTEQRTWLHHPDEGFAVVLDFAAGATAPVAPQLVGSVIAAEVAVHPGRPPRRVRFAGDPADAGRVRTVPAAVAGWDRALREVGATAARAPWQDRFAVAVAGVRLVPADAALPAPGPLGDAGRGAWAVVPGAAGAVTAVAVDDGGRGVPVVDVDPWAVLATTGGAATTLVGELVGGRFRPLSAVVDDALVPVPHPEAADRGWAGT